MPVDRKSKNNEAESSMEECTVSIDSTKGNNKGKKKEQINSVSVTKEGSMQPTSQNSMRIIPLKKSKKGKRGMCAVTVFALLLLVLVVIIGYLLFLSNRKDAVIHNMYEFTHISKKVKSITIEKDILNDLSDQWTITDYPYLKQIVVKERSMQNIQSLVICNNPLLTTIQIKSQSFYHSQSLLINNNPSLTSIHIQDQSFYHSQSLLINNNPSLTTIHIQDQSFYDTENVILSGKKNVMIIN